jgi:hypothetical protein
MWIDWNLDADFSDANELIYASGPLGITTYMTDITVPVDAKLGLARLRIRLHDTSFGPNATPCGFSNLGEVEDYLVRVVEPNTGLENDHGWNGVMIYPNPVSDELVMEVPGYEHLVDYIVCDVLGRTIFSGNFSGIGKLNMENFAAEVYFLQFNINGQQVWKRFYKLNRE